MRRNIGRPLIILALLLLSSPWSLFAQESGEGEEALFVITEVDYDMEGRTRKWALREVVELEEGMTFPSQEALEAHLSRQHQNLINQRQLQSAQVDYDVIENETGPDGVRVIVRTEDTWNIIVLPYFKYDSNDGLLLSLRGRDYNFFGTLQELSIDLDYLRTTDETNEWTIAMDFSLPFNMLQRRWRLSFEEEFIYEEGDVEFTTSAGVGYGFELWENPWEVGIRQGYSYYTMDDEPDDYYLTNTAYLNGDIGTPIPAGPMGYFHYRPETSLYVNYAFDETLSDENRGTFFTFDHELAAGGFDWIGNFRDGVEVSVGNENDYSFYRTDWDNKITGSAKGYLAVDPFGLSARTTGFYYLDGIPDDQDDAAEDIRGVLDDEMIGDIGLFLNTDVALKVWTLEPIFEMQWAAFFDVAYVTDTEGSVDEENDLRYGAGIEIIGFPLFARSLYLRGSLGFDLKRIMDGESWTDGDVREIFIGLGHHY